MLNIRNIAVLGIVVAIIEYLRFELSTGDEPPREEHGGEYCDDEIVHKAGCIMAFCCD